MSFTNSNFQESFQLQEKSFENSFDLESIETFLGKTKIDERNKKDFLSFVFGWKINGSHCEMSVFERILATPQATKLIRLVWEKFELHNHESILKMVS